MNYFDVILAQQFFYFYSHSGLERNIMCKFFCIIWFAILRGFYIIFVAFIKYIFRKHEIYVLHFYNKLW